ncbi:MAG: TatD family hydrolase [Planctomycetota bacterium]|nr:TatD family hydrolase [Planctomycetota bacterium]
MATETEQRSDKLDLFDTHTHLLDPRMPGGFSGAVERARAAGVNQMLMVESFPDRWERAIESVRCTDGVLLACALHPRFLDENSESWLRELEGFASQLDALGEIGLDKDAPDMARQREFFHAQYELAVKHKLPVSLHFRGHLDELPALIDKFGFTPHILHSYSGSAEQLDKLIETGAHVSVSGVVTYPNAKKIHSVLQRVPRDRLLLETDSPDITPHPHKREHNEPAFLPLIAKAAAKSLSTNLIQLCHTTSENARQFFDVVPVELERLVPLLSPAQLRKLRGMTFAVVGLGGVGSWAAEALSRSGAGRIVLIDGDRVAATDLNRQLFAEMSNIGELKAIAARKRLANVSSSELIAVERFVTGENVVEVLDPRPDIVLDAIDRTGDKLALIEFCVRQGIPLVSCMGAGGRLGPSAIRTADISRTEGCSLARKVRRALRSRGIESGFKAVYSAEPRISPDEAGRSCQPSSVFATAPFGFALAATAVEELLRR